MDINELCDLLVIGADYLKVFAADLKDVVEDTDNMYERMICLNNYDHHMKKLQCIRNDIESMIRRADSDVHTNGS